MRKNIKNAFVAFIHDESGQDLIEYALVAGLIGLGAVAAMTAQRGTAVDEDGQYAFAVAL